MQFPYHGNANYCCGDPKSGVKPPATPYINENKARKEKKRKAVVQKKTTAIRFYIHIV